MSAREHRDPGHGKSVTGRNKIWEPIIKVIEYIVCMRRKIKFTGLNLIQVRIPNVKLFKELTYVSIKPQR
jgi:hypothetical protein